MKRTEMERIEREIKRKEKKIASISKGEEKSGTVGDYINQLFGVLRYDHEEIFNITTDELVLEVLEDMKSNIPEKKWDDVLRKSIKKTGIARKDQAMEEFKAMMA